MLAVLRTVFDDSYSLSVEFPIAMFIIRIARRGVFSMRERYDCGKYDKLHVSLMTFCQDGMVYCAIVRVTTNPTAKTARTSASALTMQPATRKMVRWLVIDLSSSS